MPISKEIYEKLKKTYKHVASWTIWDESPVNSKTKNKNVGSFDWMDDEKELLCQLNSKYVFVALNGSDTESLSRTHVWGNFHSTNPRQKDYKLRYATVGTHAEGSYITDLFKHIPKNDNGKPIDRTKSSEVLKYLKKHPEKVEENVQSFKAEIALISKNPILIALGNAVYNYLKENMSSSYVVEKIPHYASAVKLDGSKGDYKDMLKEVLKKYEKEMR